MEVYLDHAAARPVDPRVAEAMAPYLAGRFGNPMSQHTHGYTAQADLEAARARVAALVGAAKPEEIIFTSGATEANNLAVLGAGRRLASKGRHVVISAIEHISLSTPVKALAKEGFEVTTVGVDAEGRVDPQTLRDNLRPDTVLVSVMYANGEMGAIQRVAEIGAICRERGILFHTDAVAAAGQVEIDVRRDNIDLLTLSSNDLYGPQGVGALYVRQGVRLQPLLAGGGQERGLRAGTQNLAGIVGFGQAAEIARQELPAEAARLAALRDALLDGILSQLTHAFVNGPREGRLPNNASIRVKFVEGEALLLGLNRAGIAAASGSACTSVTLEPSHVLLAMGISHVDAQGSVQFTLGRSNDQAQIDHVIEQFPRVVQRLREMSPLNEHNEQEFAEESYETFEHLHHH